MVKAMFVEPKKTIIDTNANDNHKLGEETIETFLKNETSKNQLLDFLDIDRKFADDYTHEMLVEKIMSKAKVDKEVWNDITDNFEIDNVRICSQCGQPMVVGVYAGGDYYCSDECLDEGLGIDKYLELSKDADIDEDCDYYYTEWY